MAISVALHRGLKFFQNLGIDQAFVDFFNSRKSAKLRLIVVSLAVVLMFGIVVVKYELINTKRNPVAKEMCASLRETAVDECAVAFEDSYYKGGFSGKDMDWRRIRDSNRCQNLGTNIYYACVHNSYNNRPIEYDPDD
jgi:hypothetical protein